MAAVTAAQVVEARQAGLAAGKSLQRRTRNPYAPKHVPVWKGPRTAAARAAQDRANAGRLILARVWQTAYADGQAAYAREHGLLPPDQS